MNLYAVSFIYILPVRLPSSQGLTSQKVPLLQGA